MFRAKLHSHWRRHPERLNPPYDFHGFSTCQPIRNRKRHRKRACNDNFLGLVGLRCPYPAFSTRLQNYPRRRTGIWKVYALQHVFQRQWRSRGNLEPWQYAWHHAPCDDHYVLELAHGV